MPNKRLFGLHRGEGAHSEEHDEKINKISSATHHVKNHRRFHPLYDGNPHEHYKQDQTPFML